MKSDKTTPNVPTLRFQEFTDPCTKNARKYLDNNPIIRGIDGSNLVDLILAHYESLSEKYQRMIPLEKVYIPVQSE